MNKLKKKRKNISIKKSNADWLEKYSKENNITESSILDKAIENYRHTLYMRKQREGSHE